VLNNVKTVNFHIYVLTIGNYSPDMLSMVLAAMMCNLSCGYSRCTECHAIYFKPMVLPFLSPLH